MTEKKRAKFLEDERPPFSCLISYLRFLRGEWNECATLCCKKAADWKAIGLTAEDIEAYLKPLCSKAPLPLVYHYPDGTDKVVNDVLEEEKEHLVGVVIGENTMLHFKALTKDIARPWTDEHFNEPIEWENIAGWLKDNFGQCPNARLAKESDISLFSDNKKYVLRTFEILDYHRISRPNPNWDIPAWLDRYCCVEHCNGGTAIPFYLKMYGDLLIFSDR